MGVKKGKKIASEALQGVARHTGDLIHPAQEVIEEGVEAAAKRGTKAMGKHGDDVAKAASKKGDDAIRSATKKGVTTGDFGTYREMGKRALPRDGLQHDHIPSSAAVKKAYRDQQSPRRITSTELDKVHANAPSMAVPNEWHTDYSRTYGSRNTDDVIKMDAADLPGAIDRDIDTYIERTKASGEYTPELGAKFEAYRKYAKDFYSKGVPTP